MFSDLNNDNLDRWKYFGSISNGTQFFPAAFRVFFQLRWFVTHFYLFFFLVFGSQYLTNIILEWLFWLKTCEIFYLESSSSHISCNNCAVWTIVLGITSLCSYHKKSSIRTKYILYQIEVHGFYDWHSKSGNIILIFVTVDTKNIPQNTLTTSTSIRFDSTYLNNNFKFKKSQPIDITWFGPHVDAVCWEMK